jgi:DNA-binding NarL/FixJ family response regulator
MTSVLIVDDPIVPQGCRRILQDAGVEAVFDARDVASGYRTYLRHNPDVVIVDLAMQGSGLGAAADPAHPRARYAHAHPCVQAFPTRSSWRARSKPAPPATCSRTLCRMSW